MSVVNQMLKQLDQQQTNAVTAEQFQTEQIEKKRIGLRFFLPLLIIIAGLIIAIGSDYFRAPPLHASNQRDSVETHPATTSPVQAQRSDSSDDSDSSDKTTESLSDNQQSPLAKDTIDTQKAPVPLAIAQSKPEKTNASLGPQAMPVEDTVDKQTSPQAKIKQPAGRTNVSPASATASQKAPAIKAVEKAKPSTPAKVKSLSLKSQLKQELAQIKLQASDLTSEEVINRCESILARYPAFHPARIYLLDHLRKIKSDDFYPLAKSALAGWPDNKNYLQLLARAQVEDGQYEAAATLLRGKVLSEALLQLRALTWQKLGQHRRALADYQALLRTHPRKGSYLLAFGISLKALGYSAEARVSFERAMRDKSLSATQQRWLKQQIKMLGNA